MTHDVSDFSIDEPFLSDVEARILGSLMEKQMTTPDQYPLTANSLLAACNQKSSRQPVMSLTMEELGHELHQLRSRGLVTANTLSRADRYEQHFSRKFSLKTKQRAIVCVMLLRGPQTLNEVRTRTERMVSFESLDDVETTIVEMIADDPSLLVRLPRGTGQREDRYMHLFCGQPDVSAIAAAPVREVRSALADRLSELEQEVAELREEVRQLKQQLGD